MFLATTALSEFWDTRQELLFLGPWCLRHDQRAKWESLRYEILPNPWNDRQRFQEASSYLDACNERLLSGLTDYLNGVHQQSHSRRYWRIVIGAWLFQYLHVAYDRYVRLTQALARDPHLRTRVLDVESFQVPADTSELAVWINKDFYNLQLFSHLLQLMGHDFPARKFSSLSEKPAAAPYQTATAALERRIAQARRWGSRGIWSSLRRLQGTEWGVALADMPCSTSQFLVLARQLRFQALPYLEHLQESFSQCQAREDETRKGLALLSGSTEFERLAIQSLPRHLPPLYLEGYVSAREKTLRRHHTFPSVMVSTVGWYFNEPFKFLAAEAAERGSRLVAVQHGGGYGMFRCVASEQHEARLANTFAVWGWATPSAPALRNLPSPRLSSMSDTGIRRRRRKGREILYTSTAHLRYLLRFHSFPIGIQSGDYRQWQCRFLTAVPSCLRVDIRFRLYMYEYGDATQARLQDQFPDLQFDAGRRFEQRLTQVRVVVIDHCSTTFLEALRVGVPTIIFWDPQLTEVREEAEPHFARLRQAGILWDTPEAAAAKLAEIYDDPWAWWGTEVVQAARRRFVDRYALGRDRWVDDWAKALKDELALSKDAKKSEWLH